MRVLRVAGGIPLPPGHAVFLRGTLALAHSGGAGAGYVVQPRFNHGCALQYRCSIILVCRIVIHSEIDSCSKARRPSLPVPPAASAWESPRDWRARAPMWCSMALAMHKAPAP